MNRAVETDRNLDGGRTAALVGRARSGDRQATAELLAAHLPLVYNIVGRALAGHPDTDDVVQETMLRAVDGLPGLRDPAGFRSWLVAIAMNQIRRRYRDAVPAGADGLYEAYEVPDPAADFVGLTIVRLGLSEQRREVAEATRWLDEQERELLALWWLEAAGELTRAELAAAAELSPQHAAVRVQRVKEQLETARVVVRALAAPQPCWQLAELTMHWDGIPSALWRKRFARHARECGYCSQARHGLVPAEGLLAGLAMVPLPAGYADQLGLGPLIDLGHGAGHGPYDGGHGSGGSGSAGGRGAHRRAGSRRRARPRSGAPMKVLGAAVLTAAVAGLTASVMPGSSPNTDAAQEPTAATRLDTAGEATPSQEPSGSQPASPSASAPTSTSPSPSAAPSSAAPSPAPVKTTPAPKPSATAAVPPASPPSADTVQQVIDLVNAERAKAGCGPVKASTKLQEAAQKHSDDMAARGFFDHTNPDGAGPQQRIDATGYKWNTWGENIARGQRDAAAVMDAWMHSEGHRANILNCAFTELGVGVHTGTGGPWWTQDFGKPA
ncbi:sigma-70 family RNA polymerase sigma factor [Kitasatospora sp. NPDC048540]|uniref:sigma-70 family RNA polymerase sigma factor n=1 Tax=Kitasatospora sp. NPDC048540 TaxID=3155634 RepID=UPI0033C4C2E2